ncbi:non-hydrolyzing UDP-N-acetylglucosamine 2-epimerase [Neoroseomonas soli]|uniref:UDP-N-acetylglucosamine 2-epimerase (Non-hydrolyzing) n=1 Tax=Neoroseomonas soli TaxID=1081025 RepID=A0A9X9X4P4_9PROT|nr:UDP-N-acetylglucosamine 2-epimerase (non-hydrolyzing) [Neoroseomonas soli]MBR0674373.1 UDP-N-acetylglucosamine 2-epimerase (non-hydrolyzing) [Neoroseomonas soli]
MTLPAVHLVAAARPNLPKLAALWHALAEAPPICAPLLLHTGQHHDAAMFGDLIEDLGLPAPAISLGVTGGTHADLTGRTMMACEAAWQKQRPALVVVAGDVDGALAAGLAARKMRIRVAHLEAGLRCDDRDMPEEVNRRAIDAIADLLWAPDRATAFRLIAEGHGAERVRAVGNAMVDSLLRHLPSARERPLPEGIAPGAFGIVTLHRPANVDDPEALGALLDGIAAAARHLPLVWPLHPRTRARMQGFGFAPPPRVTILPPLRYLDFLALMAHARLVATDSGGVQEEAAALGLPCLTLRPSTERPATVEAGGNRLVTARDLADAVRDPPGRAQEIPLWDGKAGARMRAHLAEVFGA